MKSKVSGVYSLILVLVAFSSLVSMFALTRLDSMIKQDFYRYGLRFSYEWALPYWTLSSIVFVVGWVDIILACAFQFYVLLYGRKREETIAPPMEVELGVEQEEDEAQKPVEEPLPSPVEADLETPEKGEEALKPPDVGEEAVVATIGAKVGTVTETTMAETMQPQETTAQRQLMVCRICGAQNPIRTEFCRYCEASLVPEVQEVEGHREQEAELKEMVEPEPKPEEMFEEPQEPADMETQEPSPPASEIEEEPKKRKKRPKRKFSGRLGRSRKPKKKTQQQES